MGENGDMYWVKTRSAGEFCGEEVDFWGIYPIQRTDNLGHSPVNIYTFTEKPEGNKISLDCEIQHSYPSTSAR